MQARTSRAALAVVALLVLASCGGGSSPAGPSSTPTPTPTASGAAPVVLDASHFDTLVLASSRPCLVEFHLPT